LCSPVLRRGRGGRPESRLPVTGWLAQSDGTARAAMGWLGQRSWRRKIPPVGRRRLGREGDYGGRSQVR
jgi:hypothetical protein